jgi:CBS domain containing-hemolysin-like protein
MIEFIAISLVTLVAAGLSAFLVSALTAVTHNRLSELVETGSAAQRSAAAALLEAKRDIHTPKTAIFITDLTLYTLGCVSLGGYAAVHLSSIELGIVAVVATAVLLIVGHLLPRALGERYAAHSVVFVAAALRALLLVTKPIVLVVRRFYNAVAPEELEETTREEITEIIETAREEGSLDAGEYRILTNIMRFSDVQVCDVMTPRTVVVSYIATMPISEAIAAPEFRQHSRFPVRLDDDLDTIEGYVLAKDMLWAMIQGKGAMLLRDLMRDVNFIPENISVDRALQHFLEGREHLFVVVDEYGGVDGLLTMEDVVETILGVEILDEADRVTNLRTFAKQRRDQRIATLREQNAQFDTSADEHASDDTNASTRPDLVDLTKLSTPLHPSDYADFTDDLAFAPHDNADGLADDALADDLAADSLSKGSSHSPTTTPRTVPNDEDAHANHADNHAPDSPDSPRTTNSTKPASRTSTREQQSYF